MKEVWRLDKATVRDVYEALREKRSIAYTTVMTMMKILEDKGYLKKSQVDRAYVYRPARPRQQVVGAMVRDFVDRVFDGAAGGLLLHLAKDGRLSKAERQRITLLIQDTEKPAREQDAEKKSGKED
jgi:predicted transcriptional regulator